MAGWLFLGYNDVVIWFGLVDLAVLLFCILAVWKVVLVLRVVLGVYIVSVITFADASSPAYSLIRMKGSTCSISMSQRTYRRTDKNDHGQVCRRALTVCDTTYSHEIEILYTLAGIRLGIINAVRQVRIEHTSVKKLC